MPNQRAKNKVFFGGFIDRRVKTAIARAAANAGMKENVFGFAMQTVARRGLARPRSQRRRS